MTDRSTLATLADQLPERAARLPPDDDGIVAALLSTSEEAPTSKRLALNAESLPRVPAER